MKRFDACSLCLQKARQPVACDEGHLFCKECVYTDLRRFLRVFLAILYLTFVRLRSYTEERY